MMSKGDLIFGDIVWTEFDPSTGHEFQKKRPALVIESDEQLLISNVVTIVPLTSTVANALPDDVIISADTTNNLKNDSVAKMHYITSFDYARFVKKIGQIDPAISLQLKGYLRKHFDL